MELIDIEVPFKYTYYRRPKYCYWILLKLLVIRLTNASKDCEKILLILHFILANLCKCPIKY